MKLHPVSPRSQTRKHITGGETCGVPLGLGWCRWKGVGVTAPFSTRWCCLAYWGGSVGVCICMHVPMQSTCTVGLKVASPSSLVFSRGTACSHGLAIKHPSFVSSLCLLPTSTLSMCKLSACQVIPPSRVLAQMGLCFKTPRFKDPHSLDPH